MTDCLNCGVTLAGRYCGNCGQRHEPQIHSLAHFIGEAFENITHADSRLWRTLGTLLRRPGELTREFLAGHRARYLPPVRFYLVVSLAFFFLASLEQDRKSIIQVDGVATTADGTMAPAEIEKTCRGLSYTGPFQDWVRERQPEQCRKLLADGGRGFARLFVQNMPKALFVLLPLLAALMLLLYWWPRRYYVEHLLFLLHNHIFLFMGYSVLLLLGLMLGDSGFVALTAVLFHLWLVWYLYRGMRVVYGQSRALTLVKYSSMLLAYLVLGIATLLVTALFSVATL